MWLVTADSQEELKNKFFGKVEIDYQWRNYQRAELDAVLIIEENIEDLSSSLINSKTAFVLIEPKRIQALTPMEIVHPEFTFVS
jgi:hypothetical protein